MSCACTTYECLDVDYNPCSEGVLLPLVANQTGTWILMVEFNDLWMWYDIAVELGEDIVIPTRALNEQYTHTIRLRDSLGDIFNDTCYKLKTQQTNSATYELTQPTATVPLRIRIKDAPDEEATDPIERPSGFTLQHDSLIGATPWSVIVIDNQNLDWADAGVDFDSETGEFDFTDSTYGQLTDGSLISIPYNAA